MSENASQERELREAAAAGAAAAVDAVAEEQHEDERQDAMEAATAVASESAVLATDYAEDAAEAATAAVTVASEAHAEADTAQTAASEAAAEATSARGDVEALREHIEAGFRSVREFIVEQLGPKPPDDTPTEVTVTHDTNRPDTGEGSNAGSGGSVESDADRRYRHRFGRARS